MTAPPAARPARAVAAIAGPLLLSGGAMLLCCVTLGATLGLAFAGFAIASLLSPPFAADDGASALPVRQRLLRQLGLLLPILLSWMWGTAAGAWDASAAVQLAMLLIFYMASLATTATAIARVAPPSIASATVTIVAVAWLAWPIWTADWMTESLASRLVSVHPLFAANAVTGLNPWPQHEVIYHLTRLGQDVPYALPTSIWPAMLLNAAIVIVCLAIAWLSRPTAAPASLS
jgi:hypothetical protein